MKEKSVFLEREGYSIKNKVLDFLIIAQDFDYSLKEIAKFAKVSYPSIKQLKKGLVRDKWITLTRKVGKAQMYRLNIKNPVVGKFIDFYWEVIENEVSKSNAKKKKEIAASHGYMHSAGMAASTKNI